MVCAKAKALANEFYGARDMKEAVACIQDLEDRKADMGLVLEVRNGVPLLAAQLNLSLWICGRAPSCLVSGPVSSLKLFPLTARTA